MSNGPDIASGDAPPPQAVSGDAPPPAAKVSKDMKWDGLPVDNWEDNFNFDKGGDCQDPIWAGLFLAQFLFFMIYGMSVLGDIDWDWIYANLVQEDTLETLGGYMGLGVCLVILYCICWLYFMRAMEGKVVKISTVILFVLQWVLIYDAPKDVVQWGLIFDALILLYLWWYNDRIPLVEAILANALQVLHENPCPIMISYIFILVSAAVNIIYAFAILAILAQEKVNDIGFIAMVISWNWSLAVIDNIVHFIVAGVTASWALNPSAEFLTAGAIKRTLTTSFGTIAYSGLVIAGLKQLRTMFVWGVMAPLCQHPDLCCNCCFKCCIDWFDETVRMYNVYALSEAAVFGIGYCDGVARFFDVFKSKGMDVIGTYACTWIVYTVCKWTGSWLILGLLKVVIDEVLVSLLEGKDFMGMIMSLVLFIIMVYVFWLLGNAIVNSTMTIVESVVCTIFVIWAEDSAQFSASQPDQFKKIYNAMLSDTEGAGAELQKNNNLQVEGMASPGSTQMSSVGPDGADLPIAST